MVYPDGNIARNAVVIANRELGAAIFVKAKMAWIVLLIESIGAVRSPAGPAGARRCAPRILAARRGEKAEC
jgi:hypothetical protein